LVTIAGLAVANRPQRQANGENVTREVTFSPSTLAGGRPLTPRKRRPPRFPSMPNAAQRRPQHADDERSGAASQPAPTQGFA
jgi:hypothetical protein